MQDRVQKTKDEVQKCREKYEQALQEINKYNPIYIEDMSSVFVKCQEMEETRLRFFKKVLFSIHKTLNVAQDPRYAATMTSISRLQLAPILMDFCLVSAYHKSMRNFITQSTMPIIKRIWSGGRTIMVSTWQWLGRHLLYVFRVFVHT